MVAKAKSSKIKMAEFSFPPKTAPMKKAFDTAISNYKKKNKALKAPKIQKYKDAQDNFPIKKYKIKK